MSSSTAPIESLDLKGQPRLDADITKDKRFQGKVAIVTGGAGGIGSAVVARFLNDGAQVAFIDLNGSRAAELLANDFAAAAEAGRVRHYSTDVSRRQNCFDVVDKVVRDFGKVNFLINAVAYFKCAGLESDDDMWEQSNRVNVSSYAFMGQAAYKHMKELTKQGEPCAIVNFSSISAHQIVVSKRELMAFADTQYRVQPNRWTYLAAKGAVNILTKAMALDMTPGRVRVNSIAPSWIWSPETAKTCQGTRAEWEANVVGPFHMMKRMGEMSEVAAAATFLCSRDASYVNASELKVDGGYGAMSAEGHGAGSNFAGTK